MKRQLYRLLGGAVVGAIVVIPVGIASAHGTWWLVGTALGLSYGLGCLLDRAGKLG